MAGGTDRGRSRRTNQDSIFYDQNFGVGIIADGIGGRKGGEIASSLAVSHVRKSLQDGQSVRSDETRQFMINVIDRANLAIMSKGEQSKTHAGMGTTINCLWFRKKTLFLGHVGDSRTYLFYKGNMWQLTLDHNVGQFLERGWLKSSSLPNNWKGQALVRALGLSSYCDVDVYQRSIQPGEIYITASDGLFDMVRDHEICQLVNKNFDNLRNLPKILIKEANRRGGRDNITVLISKVVDEQNE